MHACRCSDCVPVHLETPPPHSHCSSGPPSLPARTSTNDVIRTGRDDSVISRELAAAAATVVEHVVADAGAFLKRAPLQVNYFTEFSKMTGDYPSLSATDIKVPALTYQLETENVGTEHLKKEPEEKAPSMQHTETPDGIAGFHFPSKSSNNPNPVVHSPPTTNDFQFWRRLLPSIETDLLELLAADAITDTDQLESVDLSADGQLAASEDRDGSNEDQHEEEEESSDDGGGWITPSNIKQVQMDAGNWGPTADVRNVLIQIGLHVLSVNGMLIKYSRSYILRCHACFKTTTNMNKSFCPHCGNNTLKKIAVSINEDGTMQMHFSGNPKVLNPKGKRVSNALDAKFGSIYVCDIYSRSDSLQLRDAQTGGGRRRTNPNAACKKLVKK
uniref:NIN1 (RPN12) binding protein 1 homolog n=1 Tax=Cyprinus carpio TaxID=7962 RepID=A0A8C1YN68_CYPCA